MVTRSCSTQISSNTLPVPQAFEDQIWYLVGEGRGGGKAGRKGRGMLMDSIAYSITDIEKKKKKKKKKKSSH